MAVKGVGMITDITTSSSGTFQVSVKIAATDGATLSAITVPNVPADILQTTFDTAIRNAVKDELINHYGFTFGLFDSVRLLGASLPV